MIYGILCMYDDILCMHVGMLWINIGMLCMHVGILCMNVGMVCSMNAIDMLEILSMLNLTDLPLPHMTDVKRCTSRPPYERGLGIDYLVPRLLSCRKAGVSTGEVPASLVTSLRVPPSEKQSGE